MNIHQIEGGVCAAKGFTASGVHCGIRRNKSKKDLALILSSQRAAAAAVYTTNLVKGAPLLVTKKHLTEPYASAILCNSGNANTCNADGEEIAERMCHLVQEHTGIPQDDVIVASTGVIGQKLEIEPIANGMAELIDNLSDKNSISAAEAIMTTDTIAKEIAVEFEIGGKICHLGGIAKGSGMIHPNMATMLVFLTTDTKISPEMLSKALKEDVKTSFHMVSIDGDTSTNDMVTILANGLAENPEISSDGADFAVFQEALHLVTTKLCRLIAGDGEGATKLLICKIFGAKSKEDAKKAAKSVICSSLFKAAMFGADANFGRVLCALGYSGADIDIDKIDICFESAKGKIAVCKNGNGLDFSEEKAKEILLEKEITVLIDFHSGTAGAESWGCDLTYDYVKINGDYRT